MWNHSWKMQNTSSSYSGFQCRPTDMTKYWWHEEVSKNFWNHSSNIIHSSAVWSVCSRNSRTTELNTPINIWLQIYCGSFRSLWTFSYSLFRFISATPLKSIETGVTRSWLQLMWERITQFSELPFKPKGGTYMILRRYISGGLFCRRVPSLCWCGVPKQTHKSSLLSGGIFVPNKADEPRAAPSWKVLFRHDSDTKLLLSWKHLACVKWCRNICHATFFFPPTTLLTFWFPNFLFFCIFHLCSPPLSSTSHSSHW